MSSNRSVPSPPGPPKLPQPPSATPPIKKKVRIRKDGKWANVDIDGEVVKGRFKYVKFIDDDGLETYWISPE